MLVRCLYAALALMHLANALGRAHAPPGELVTVRERHARARRMDAHPAALSNRRGHPARMTVFFTSDTHFGDRRVLQIDRRPFGSVALHDAALVARWNELVASNDEVWHLGDFTLGAKLD